MHSSRCFKLKLSVLLTLLLFCSCVKLPRTAPQHTPYSTSTVSTQYRIDINSATAEELSQLPGIGPVLAERIVAHRERYGAFRRPEHLMMVRGISDRRFRKIRDFIKVD